MWMVDKLNGGIVAGSLMGFSASSEKTFPYRLPFMLDIGNVFL